MFKKLLSSLLIGTTILTTSIPTIAMAEGPVYEGSEETPYEKAEDEAVDALTQTYLDLKSVDQEVITHDMRKETANPIIKLAQKIINTMKEILQKLKEAFKETFYSDRGTITVKYMHGGKEIAESEIHNDLKLGEYTYAPIEIEGYFCNAQEQTVEITKENPIVDCVFEYETNASKLPKQITLMYKTIELDENGNIIEGSEKDIIDENGQPYTEVFNEENSPLGQGYMQLDAKAKDFPQYDVYGTTETTLVITKDAPQASHTFYYTQAHGNIKIISFYKENDTDNELTEEVEYSNLIAGSIYKYTPEDIGEYEPVNKEEILIEVIKNTTTEIKVEYVKKEKISGTLNLICVDEDGNEIIHESKEITEFGDYQIEAPDFTEAGYSLMAGENKIQNYSFSENKQTIDVKFVYVKTGENKANVNAELKKADAMMDEVLRYMSNREEKIGKVTVIHKKEDGTLLEKAVYKDLTIDDFVFEAKVNDFSRKGITELIKVKVNDKEVELSDEVTVSITSENTEFTIEFIYK